MDVRLFNVCLLIGWLMVLGGGVVVSVGWGIAFAGGLLLVLTLAGAYAAGLTFPKPPKAGAD